jgi:hypothetical protein
MYSWEFSVQYRKSKSVLSEAVLSFIVIEIFPDVHRAVFASARPNQHLKSWKRERHRVKLKVKDSLKGETYYSIKFIYINQPW